MTERNATFGRSDHESLQYHFRCGPMIGAARVFRTTSLEHSSAWIWKDGCLLRLHEGRSFLREAAVDRLCVTDGVLRIEENNEGVVRIMASCFQIALRPRHIFRWCDTISNVIHQPDMICDLEFKGENFSGIGYCKRYAWTPAPRYWGYRFVQGWSDDNAAVWTAEANFGAAKYDYFRLLEPDGRLYEGGTEASRHREDAVLCDLPQGQVRVTLSELAVWETPLVSPRMDSLLRQRVCRMIIEIGDVCRKGLAINETCFGTLG